MNLRTPSFTKPPLVETAVSIQFEAIESFSNAHLGIFWNKVRHEFPMLDDAPPIDNQKEEFGNGFRRTRLPRITFSPAPTTTRLRMTSDNRQAMLQVQNGRFVFNWRKREDSNYPRWTEVFPQFQHYLKKFDEMLVAEKLPSYKPNQWEVTYVNHLVRGVDWGDSKDWPLILPGMIGKTSSISVGTIETVNVGVHMALPDKIGRLHIELNHGFKTIEPDSPEVLTLQLTARGGITSSHTQEQVLELFDIGHNSITQGFCDITSRNVQEKWGRTL